MGSTCPLRAGHTWRIHAAPREPLQKRSWASHARTGQGKVLHARGQLSSRPHHGWATRFSAPGCRYCPRARGNPAQASSSAGAEAGAGTRAGPPTEASIGAHRLQGSVARNDANDTGPLLKPSPKLSAVEAAAMQLSALAANDEPRDDHGLEVLYYFANAEGTLAAGPSSSAQEALPRYFGCAADLYHFGHFALKFKSRYKRLINHRGFRILEGGEEARSGALQEGQRRVVRAAVLCSREGVHSAPQGSQAPPAAGEEVWEIGMSVVVRGISPPCWLTDFVRPVGPLEP